MVIAIAAGIILGLIVSAMFPGSGLSEYLSEILIQTCCAGVGFAAGAVWMRDNYIQHIKEMQKRITELENGGNTNEQNYGNF